MSSVLIVPHVLRKPHDPPPGVPADIGLFGSGVVLGLIGGAALATGIGETAVAAGVVIVGGAALVAGGVRLFRDLCAKTTAPALAPPTAKGVKAF